MLATAEAQRALSPESVAHAKTLFALGREYVFGTLWKRAFHFDEKNVVAPTRQALYDAGLMRFGIVVLCRCFDPGPFIDNVLVLCRVRCIQKRRGSIFGFLLHTGLCGQPKKSPMPHTAARTHPAW